jgi:cytoskeleton protein RodZ
MNEAQGLPAPPESDVASGVDTPGVETPGALLKRERERRALSVEQAAEDLHLDPWIIEAIEANRFQALGAPVYAKGHLRKYATQLSLPVDDIVARYDSLQDRPTVIDPIPAAIAAPLPQPRRSYKGIVMTAAGLLIVAVLTWAVIEFVAPLLKRNSSAPVTAPAPTVAPPAVVAPAAAPVPDNASNASSVPVEPSAQALQPATSEVLASTAPAQTAPPAQIEAQANPPPVSAVPTEGALQVRLQFSGDSWTEVYDAQGARLMFAMGSEGRTRTITGVPPLQFTIGSVSAVTLEVNGEPVAIPRRDGRESSRFVIEADGNLR